jgi:hypothetical protein
MTHTSNSTTIPINWQLYPLYSDTRKKYAVCWQTVRQKGMRIRLLNLYNAISTESVGNQNDSIYCLEGACVIQELGKAKNIMRQGDMHIIEKNGTEIKLSCDKKCKLLIFKKVVKKNKKYSRPNI